MNKINKLKNRPPLSYVFFWILYLNIYVYILLFILKYGLRFLYYSYRYNYWVWDIINFKDPFIATICCTIPISLLYLLLYFYGSDKNWTYKKSDKKIQKEKEDRFISILSKEVRNNSVRDKNDL